LSYWVVVVTRNGASHLPRTLDSLLNQREAPRRVTIVDDGSTDDTPNILRKYLRLHDNVSVLTKPDRGYDIRRVPANINQAWAKNTDLTTEYFMISGDDCTYPTNYAASLLARMQADLRLVVASGRPSTDGSRSREHSPSGSGRMVRCSFWRQVGGAYPSKAGWETWLLYKAAESTFQAQLFDDLTYEHARPRGAGHQFVYWGAAMSTLGYPPLYAIGRIAVNGLKPAFAPRRAMNMLRGYFQAKLGSVDTFMSPYERSLQSFVKQKQSQRIANLISSTLSVQHYESEPN
jgi:hypothetical protein